MVYIQKERRHDEGSQYRQHAREKMEKYLELRVPFQLWAQDNALTDPLILEVGLDNFIESGLNQLQSLVDAWYQVYQTGEMA